MLFWTAVLNLHTAVLDVEQLIHIQHQKLINGNYITVINFKYDVPTGKECSQKRVREQNGGER